MWILHRSESFHSCLLPDILILSSTALYSDFTGASGKYISSQIILKWNWHRLKPLIFKIHTLFSLTVQFFHVNRTNVMFVFHNLIKSLRYFNQLLCGNVLPWLSSNQWVLSFLLSCFLFLSPFLPFLFYFWKPDMNHLCLYSNLHSYTYAWRLCWFTWLLHRKEPSNGFHRQILVLPL